MLHVIRHGERRAFQQRCGNWNAEWSEKHARCWDDPLTTIGKKQAKEAAQQLQLECAAGDEENSHGNPFPRRIISSPFVRCVETALEFAAVFNLQVEVDEALCENLRSEWFKHDGRGIKDIMLSIEEIKKKYHKVIAIKDQLFPSDVMSNDWEDEHHDRLVRPESKFNLSLLL